MNHLTELPIYHHLCCQNYLQELNSEQFSRIKHIKANSQTFFSPNIDLISACNFSYWVFKNRIDLIKYFINSHKCLKKDGILILDAFGGYEAHQELEERTKYKEW